MVSIYLRIIVSVRMAWENIGGLSMHQLPPMRRALMIAIVDDDDAVRKAMASLLRSLGHSVAAFDSAEAFLESGQVSTSWGAPAEWQARSAPMSIAIVDDDAVVCGALKSLMRSLGYDASALAQPRSFSSPGRSAAHRASSARSRVDRRRFVPQL